MREGERDSLSLSALARAKVTSNLAAGKVESPRAKRYPWDPSFRRIVTINLEYFNRSRGVTAIHEKRCDTVRLFITAVDARRYLEIYVSRTRQLFVFRARARPVVALVASARKAGGL